MDTYILPFRAVGTVPALNTLTNPIIPDFNYFDLWFSYNVTDEVTAGWGASTTSSISARRCLGSSVSGNVTFPGDL